jgi:hypothetical protein
MLSARDILSGNPNPYNTITWSVAQVIHPPKKRSLNLFSERGEEDKEWRLAD